MKTQNTSNAPSNVEKAIVPPTLTRALRAAIQADKLGNILFTAGATKLRGTPTEVLEEVAAAQTAAWIVGFQSGPMAGPLPVVAQPETLEVAVDAIDTDALGVAGAIVGVRGAGEVEKIRSYLAANLASTAFEATRFALAEDRPVCHNCVAIGGSSVARSAPTAAFSQNQPILANR
ncbi:MAG TPA: hypothetical protein VGB18_09515 [Candidatus Thermoplasmatota archaeon]